MQRIVPPFPSIAFCVALAFLLSPAADAQLVGSWNQFLEGINANYRQGEALAFCDFDGDGDEDLAVGVPEAGASSGSLNNIGLVVVYYSRRFDGTFQSIEQSQFFRLGEIEGGSSNAGDLFGAALAAADFNLDGACDLAIGIPGAEVAGETAAGRVVIVDGRVGSVLDLDATTYFDQSVLTGTPESGDRFGSVLAAGRVGENAYPDLVVGVPNDRVGTQDEAGVIHLISARDSDGLEVDANARLHQDTENMFGVAGAGDHFGASLAIGDVTGDGVPDLVVGSPGDRVGLVQDAGAVQVIPGGASGVEISVEDQFFLTQEVDDVLGDSATGDEWGAALQLGDFNGDNWLDLAIGAPGESQFGPAESGAVQVFYGTSIGLSVNIEQVLFESLFSPEIATFDRFGSALTSADFDQDGFDELVVGYALDNVFGVVNAGNVAVLAGAAPGLQTSGAQLWNGFSLSSLTLGAGDELGTALAAGRFGGESFGVYLAIGIPGRMGENMEPEEGGVVVLRSQIPIFSDGFEQGDTLAWSSVFP